jgi:hypothetical protein
MTAKHMTVQLWTVDSTFRNIDTPSEDLTQDANADCFKWFKI